MRHPPRALGLLAVLLAGSAGAQDLGAYQALAARLEAAAAVRPASAERALGELDRAREAYTRLAPTVQNRQLLSGLEDALGGARAALARTPAELQAQVLLARGLMRKALYDQTLSGLAGASAEGAAGVRLLAAEFGLTGGAAQALVGDARGGRPERVAWRLQRTAADKVSAALAAARPERSPGAYLDLARAAGWFTVVQDAEGARGLEVAGFTGALRQLTAGDLPALRTSLTALRRGADALGRSLAAPPALAGTGGTGTSAPRATPPSAPAKPAPTQPTPNKAAPAGSSALSSAGSVDAAYAALGRALTASGHGDPAAARAELGRAAAALAAAPSRLRRAEGYERLTQDLVAARVRPGLRPGEVQALIAGLDGLERGAAGKNRSAVDTLSAGVARTFSGGVRAAAFLGLALAALVPLYLLHLAFGGRNPYWRAILAALALLLLPVFLEGVFGFLGWLGDLGGVPVLRAASILTLSQGEYGRPLGALLAALAILLSAYGFRGLCRQFGLLGRPRPAERPATQALEWDEDV